MEVIHLAVGLLGTNCYFLSSGKEAVLVDPGGNAKEISELVKNSGKNLKAIICTHYHGDHTAAVLKIKEETGAPILIHEKEKKFIEFEVDRFLKEGDVVKLGDEELKVIHTPGHTEGSICLLGKDFILTGDTLFYEGVGRTDLAGGSEEQLNSSLEKLNNILKPGFKVFPGHGETFTVPEI